MRQYNPYTPDENLAALTALAKVWSPPPAAGPTAPNGLGNCIEASRFASQILTALHAEHDITVVRARYTAEPYGGLVGFGDCGSFVAPQDGSLGGHCVLVGNGWLFDASAAQFAGQDGPVIALPSLPHDRGEWAADRIWYQRAYGFEPIRRRTPRGTATAIREHVAAVRGIIGPRRKPRAYAAY